MFPKSSRAPPDVSYVDARFDDVFHAVHDTSKRMFTSPAATPPSTSSNVDNASKSLSRVEVNALFADNPIAGVALRDMSDDRRLRPLACQSSMTTDSNAVLPLPVRSGWAWDDDHDNGNSAVAIERENSGRTYVNVHTNETLPVMVQRLPERQRRQLATTDRQLERALGAQHTRHMRRRTESEASDPRSQGERPDVVTVKERAKSTTVAVHGVRHNMTHATEFTEHERPRDTAVYDGHSVRLTNEQRAGYVPVTQRARVPSVAPMPVANVNVDGSRHKSQTRRTERNEYASSHHVTNGLGISNVAGLRTSNAAIELRETSRNDIVNCKTGFAANSSSHTATSTRAVPRTAARVDAHVQQPARGAHTARETQTRSATDVVTRKMEKAVNIVRADTAVSSVEGRSAVRSQAHEETDCYRGKTASDGIVRTKSAQVGDRVQSINQTHARTDAESVPISTRVTLVEADGMSVFAAGQIQHRTDDVIQDVVDKNADVTVSNAPVRARSRPKDGDDQQAPPALPRSVVADARRVVAEPHVGAGDSHVMSHETCTRTAPEVEHDAARGTHTLSETDDRNAPDVGNASAPHGRVMTSNVKLRDDSGATEIQQSRPSNEFGRRARETARASGVDAVAVQPRSRTSAVVTAAPIAMAPQLRSTDATNRNDVRPGYGDVMAASMHARAVATTNDELGQMFAPIALCASSNVPGPSVATEASVGRLRGDSRALHNTLTAAVSDVVSARPLTASHGDTRKHCGLTSTYREPLFAHNTVNAMSAAIADQLPEETRTQPRRSMDVGNAQTIRTATPANTSFRPVNRFSDTDTTPTPRRDNATPRPVSASSVRSPSTTQMLSGMDRCAVSVVS